MMSAPPNQKNGWTEGNRSRTVRRENRDYEIRGEFRIRGRRYSILEHLGGRRAPRLLLDDPHARQLRVALLLPRDSSTAQHLNVLRRLPHSDELPRIIDYDRQRERTVILLTWIKGIDLGQYLQRVAKGGVVAPSPYEAVRLVRGLAHGLNRLNKHAQIVHADLAPRNLILTRKPSRLVMIDFGSAWPIERTLFRAEGDGLSPVYAAPELQRGESALATLADQFSATLILYQLLTGEVPYAGLGGQAGRPGYVSECGELAPASESSEALRLLPRELSKSIDAFLARGLRLDPDERYPTSSAWLDAVEAIFLQLKLHLHSPGRPASPWERFLDAVTDRLFGRRPE
jgi:serine/threonine protein kinase